nr:DNA helicase [Tanacetum cinerariifolium]
MTMLHSKDGQEIWSPRRNSRSAIGRLAYVHPTSELCVSHWVCSEMTMSRTLQCKRHVYQRCRPNSDLFFLTFSLIKTIISTLCCEGKIVLAVALSGIASLLLPSGLTAHSRFKLPIELTEESLCKVTKNSQLRKLLAVTDLIIWDEAPMNDRRCFEALDRSLRDILTMPHRLFGGKSILLGGDFRQTLPVKKGASKMEIITSCISQSELWPHFKVFILNKDMRLSRPGVSADERNLISSFALWLMDIGDGRTGEPDQEDFENIN